MSKKTLYTVLGVSDGASPQEIEQAFTQRMADPALDDGMRVALREAHAVLSNMTRRNAYDSRLRDEARTASELQYAVATGGRLDEPHGYGKWFLILGVAAFVLGAVLVAQKLRAYANAPVTKGTSAYDAALERQRDINAKIDANRQQTLEDIRRAQDNPPPHEETAYEREQRQRNESNDRFAREQEERRRKEAEQRAQDAREQQQAEADAEARDRNRQQLERDKAYLKQLEDDNQRMHFK